MSEIQAQFVQEDELPDQQLTWAKAFRLIKRQPLGAAGGLIVVIMILAAIFADLINVSSG